MMSRAGENLFHGPWGSPGWEKTQTALQMEKGKAMDDDVTKIIVLRKGKKA